MALSLGRPHRAAGRDRFAAGWPQADCLIVGGLAANLEVPLIRAALFSDAAG